MSQLPQVNILEDNEIQKIVEQIKRNYYWYIISVIFALGVAYFLNQYTKPTYQVSSSILIKDDKGKLNMGSDYLNSSLIGKSNNLQNELEIMKSSKVLEQTVKNLDLTVNYYQKKNFQYIDLYARCPFQIKYQNNHIQPLNTYIQITFLGNGEFFLNAEADYVTFWNFEKNAIIDKKSNWQFSKKGKINELVETPELSCIISVDSQKYDWINKGDVYYFSFKTVSSIVSSLKWNLTFDIANEEASLIKLYINTESPAKGVDVLNGIMNVYSTQNLEKKNYLASMTIDYINRQLGEISDSLNQAEQKLQRFRSSNQIIDLNSKASGISEQYITLQNKMAELVMRKRYVDNLNSNLSADKLNNLTIPASLGIGDDELNKQVGELIAAQAQRATFIENKQDKNPMVKKLNSQINNLKDLITENLSNIQNTLEIEIDELHKRISKIESEISRIPSTERQLVGMERNFKLNDAIFNYLLEKRAEANITKASNLPDNEILEPASLESFIMISPDTKKNYMIAFLIGLFMPFVVLQAKSFVNNKIESQDTVERITNIPVLGKILHNHKKTINVVFEFPASSISESYRALRTNMEYYVRGSHKKVIMVTSSIEGEGKSFNALNIAMCYAQLGRRTILLNFDLRKKSNLFGVNGEDLVGMSSYLINKASLDDVIIKSPHEKLDYIPSGPIPPNPVELIGLERTEDLVIQLKNTYDYVIIDTPPLAQVTDAYLLLGFADVKVLVVRYNYTLKSVFSHVVKDLKQKNIENFCIVLNDNRVLSDQYGYGYGYNKSRKG